MPRHRAVSRLALLGLTLACLGCSPITATRGNLVENDRLSQVKVGLSDREQVEKALGPPTATATFEKNSWYYIGQTTKQYSFLDPEVVRARIIAVRFDPSGKVASIQDLPTEGADIDPVDRTTAAAGREESFTEQMLGNLSHPTLPSMGNTGGPGH